MARFLLCVVFVAGAVACTDDADPRIAALTADLEQARDRLDELERQALVEEDRYVDLWSGGPTTRGALVALPRLGVLRWTCDDDYGFRIVFEPAGASVHVSHHTPRAGAARIVHPGQQMGATVRAGESVDWVVTYRHEPGFIRARVEVTAERSRHGNCLLPSVRVKETAERYD